VKQFNPTTGLYEPAATLAPGRAYWLRALRSSALTLPAAAQHAITYTYNGDGLQVAKSVQGVTTRYLYDGVEIVAELSDAGAVTTSYVHGPGIDELLAVRDHASGQALYPLTDHLGSAIGLTDAAGAVQATFSYAAFGATRSNTGFAGTRFGFTGRENDPESGLYHYRARAYDPAIGRFLQPDPLPRTPADPRMMGLGYVSRLAAVGHPLPGGGFLPIELPEVGVDAQAAFLSSPPGFNRYPYVLNNPLSYTDPTGESAEVVAVAIALAEPTFIGELILVGATVVTAAYAIYQANKMRWAEPFPYQWNVPGPHTGGPLRRGEIRPPPSKLPAWAKWAALAGIGARVAKELNDVHDRMNVRLPLVKTIPVIKAAPKSKCGS